MAIKNKKISELEIVVRQAIGEKEVIQKQKKTHYCCWERAIIAKLLWGYPN